MATLVWRQLANAFGHRSVSFCVYDSALEPWERYTPAYNTQGLMDHLARHIRDPNFPVRCPPSNEASETVAATCDCTALMCKDEMLAHLEESHRLVPKERKRKREAKVLDRIAAGPQDPYAKDTSSSLTTTPSKAAKGQPPDREGRSFVR